MNRDEAIEKLSGGNFDVVVVGGGIYGCWTALDAARRGLSVALLEQHDWASGTSSCSSKLIHGGLRYLEHGWLGLVRKSLTERQNLLQLCPFRVRPLEFLLPLYKQTRFKSWSLRLGLWVYDRLAGNDNTVPRGRRWSTFDFTKQFPWLSSTTLRHAFSYGDAQVDDCRLTLEVALAARQAGALALTRLQLISSVGDELNLTDQLTGKSLSCQANAIVMACGPWPAGDARPGTRRTKGVHLVMPSLPDNVAVLLTSPTDGRVGFMIPWEGRTLVGTTDDDWHGDPATLTVTQDEEDYLLAMANVHLATPWTRNDIAGRYAGVRVLQSSGGKTPSGTTREWSLNKNGIVFTTSGGKLTSARVEASDTVDAILETLGKTKVACHTLDPLPRTAQEDPETWMSRAATRAGELGLDRTAARALCRRYGTAVYQIFALIDHDAELAKPIVEGFPYLLAEVVFSVRYEDALDLEDILRRRIPLSILTSLDRNTLIQVAKITAEVLNWDEHRQQQEVDRMRIL